MAQSTLRKKRKPFRGDSTERWASLLKDDVVGIDGDIDRLVDLYQGTHGGTRDMASAALVMKFLCLTEAGA
jgi:hypothetical protein